ncbi:sugar kinase [uncultured Roseobacter sp.]|uniref:sugar kinase n=1 Tax=uncultured Roseobacter sp. TaxID=114847 RepID=UPI0026300112|nr:sugar kinase [uncultured Roseobacter sp.]
MNMKVACVGEAMIELSMMGDTAGVGVAGDTLNTAIYLKRCAPALQVDYVSCIGDDPFSQKIHEFIASQKIGCDHLVSLPDATPGLYAITTTPDGERSFTYWRNASAARRMFQGGKEPDFSVLDSFDVVYLSGITMAILPHPVRLALLDWLAQSRVRFAYDSNFRPALWEDAATARAVTSVLWARADIALPSVDDEMALFEQSAEDVARRFQDLGMAGALKQGADGPLSLGQDVQQSYPPASKVLDTTAAGDSFNGGYLGALLTGAGQAEALMAGHACAARVVAHRGAIIPPDAI